MEKNNKSGMLFCQLAIIISLFGGIFFASQAKGGWYPFSENPTLSYSDFKRNFRQKYAHLKIPDITVRPDRPSLGGFCHNHNKITINPRLHGSAADAELTLLHETGHSYVSSVERAKYLENGKIASEKECVDIQANASLLQKTFAVMNVAHFLYKGLNVRLLYAFGLMGYLSNSPHFIRFYMYDRAYKKHVILPEEIMADNFANQHASEDVLRAGLLFYSKKGYYDYLQKVGNLCSEKCRYLIKDELKKGSPDYGLIIRYKIIERINLLMAHMPFQYEFQNCVDVAHPSMPERQDAIRKALRERFGVDE